MAFVLFKVCPRAVQLLHPEIVNVLKIQLKSLSSSSYSFNFLTWITQIPSNVFYRRVVKYINLRWGKLPVKSHITIIVLYLNSRKVEVTKNIQGFVWFLQWNPEISLKNSMDWFVIKYRKDFKNATGGLVFRLTSGKEAQIDKFTVPVRFDCTWSSVWSSQWEAVQVGGRIPSRVPVPVPPADCAPEWRLVSRKSTASWLL